MDDGFDDPHYEDLCIVSFLYVWWLKEAGLGIFITHEKPPRFLTIHRFEFYHTPGQIHQFIHSIRPLFDSSVVVRRSKRLRRIPAIDRSPV